VGHDRWSCILLLGLWGWIISSIIFIFRGFPRTGTFAGRDSWKWGIAALLSFALWIIGLLTF